MVEALVRAATTLLRLPEGPPTLPHGDPREVRVFRAAPAFLAYRVVVAAARSVLPALLAAAVLLVASWVGVPPETPELAWTLRGAAALVVLWGLVVGVAAVVVARVDYGLRHYVVTDRSLRIREGALVVRELTLSFENVQNVVVEQGPLERLLGIANVTVDTAGGGGGAAHAHGGSVAGHRGRLRGVDNAPEVRDLILRRLERYAAGAGLGDDAQEGFSPEELQALRAVREETRALAREVAGGVGETARAQERKIP